MAKKLTAAQKAHQTLAARRAFADKYGQVALEIVLDLLSDNVSWTDGTTAAYKANLNRPGTFRTMALACASRAR